MYYIVYVIVWVDVGSCTRFSPGSWLAVETGERRDGESEDGESWGPLESMFPERGYKLDWENPERKS